MTMVRKRKPGGGAKAKPAGDRKSENFNARIDPDTKDSLEAEVRARNALKRPGAGRISEAAVAGEALRIGLATLRAGGRRGHTEAMLFIVRRLADELTFEVGGRAANWKTDRYIADLLRRTITLLLDELHPSTPTDDDTVASIHQTLIETLDIPQFQLEKITSLNDWAEAVFAKVWFSVVAARSVTAWEAQLMYGLDDKTAANWSRDSYSYDQVRDDLGIGKGKS